MAFQTNPALRQEAVGFFQALIEFLGRELHAEVRAGHRHAGNQTAVAAQRAGGGAELIRRPAFVLLQMDFAVIRQADVQVFAADR